LKCFFSIANQLDGNFLFYLAFLAEPHKLALPLGFPLCNFEPLADTFLTKYINSHNWLVL